jgi:alpha-amylase
VVLNHRMGADHLESVRAVKCDSQDRRRRLVENKKILAWTGFRFPARKRKYSSFKWNASHFTAVDWNQQTQSSAVYKLMGRRWSEKVDGEYGNYDYLMGADVNFANPEVREELLRWGKWYFETAKLDGVRLDAVKHISYAFFVWWLKSMRRDLRREFFAVGEYWHSDVNVLKGYLENSHRTMSLFDVSLHFKFLRAGMEGRDFDLRTIFDDTLVSAEPELAVTFVDNHDTQPGQALQSWIPGWFKPLAYALILLREQGTPCVFFGDLFGIPHDGIAPVRELENLLRVRRDYARGAQTDYFDHGNVIGWTREGGMATVISNGDDGWKTMKLGNPGQVFIDALGNRDEEITVGENGWADFTVNGGSVSVWVPKN